MSGAAGPAADAVDPAAMRAARRRWATGVTVVVAADGEGGVRGATVSAFAVVSLEPPLLLICLDRDGRMSTLVPDQGAFAVSVLDRRHEFVADRLAGRGPVVDARFGGVPHAPAPSGLPVLDDALAWFDCRVRAVHDGGDHVVIVGLVTAVGVGLGAGAEVDDPLLYYEGGYRSLDAE